jgi:nitroreductase/NAD-dependent dihydropyrimidine dehydrogenase PreA subunit
MLLEKHRLTIDPPTRYARLRLDEQRCNACGRCVETCPMQLLEMEGDKVRSNRRYAEFKCITCQNCVASCAMDAITIEGDYRVERGYWKNDHLFASTKTLPEPPEAAKGLRFEQYRDQLTETERIMLTRRSVRLYKKKAVEPDKLRRILEAGRFAPSAGNNQPWKFVVIRNAQVIDEMNDLCKRALGKSSYLLMPHAYLEKRCPGPQHARYTWWQKLLIPLLSHLRTGDVEPRARGGINTATSDPDYHVFFHAPVLILLLADSRGIGSVELDTGICGQNLVLAAHALGLGTCWVSLVRGINYYPDYLQRLGVEEPFRVITSIAVGYPAGRIDGIVAREPARVHWVD